MNALERQMATIRGLILKDERHPEAGWLSPEGATDRLMASDGLPYEERAAAVAEAMAVIDAASPLPPEVRSGKSA